MSFAALLGISLLAVGAGEYTRPLDAKSLDQATLNAEGYGETSALHREEDGLRITLEPGKPETGWKTPQQLRIGGDFTITAEFVLHTLPKPAQEDGAAVGLAIATQTPDQPDVTLVRLIEPDGSDVYRIDHPGKRWRNAIASEDDDDSAIPGAGGQAAQAPPPDVPRLGRLVPPGVAPRRQDRPLPGASTPRPINPATSARRKSGPMTSRP